MFAFWLILFVVLLVVELSTINLVSIWFALGALFASLATYLTDEILLQVGVFSLVGALSFVLLRPLLRKFSSTKKEATNLDRVLGLVGMVTEDILPFERGEVKVDGKRWTAVAEEEIQKGQTVVVEAIDGVKLKVRKKKEEE